MDATKPYPVNAEFAELLKEAAAAGRPLSVTIDDRIYRLSITPVPVTETADLWKDYDPELVRAAVVRASDIFTEDEAQELIEHVYRAREEGSRPASRP